MAAVPLGLASRKRLDLPEIVLRNWYYERVPENVEDQVALIPRPRLVQFAIAGNGPINGTYRKGGVLANSGYSGSIITLSASNLYRVTQTGLDGVGTATLLGAIEGSKRLSAEGNAAVVCLTAGTQPYTTDGASLAEITFPDDKQVSAIDTLAGYFIFGSELGRFYWSAPGGTTVSALDYATAESQPDVLITLRCVRDELWLYGRLSIEVWTPTGDADLPFRRTSGRIFGIGITARDSLKKIEESLFWVGTDRQVYRTNPNPVKISDAAMDERLLRADPDDLYAFTYEMEGHQHYCLQIPTEGTFAFDVTTERWHEITSFGRDLFRCAVSTIGPNGQPLLGDSENGIIWEMSTTGETENGGPIVYECMSLIENSGGPVRCNNVILDCSVGHAADIMDDPVIQMRRTERGMKTWDDWQSEPLGRLGVYDEQVSWGPQGTIERPGALLHFRTTKRATLRKVRINEDLR
jgi:hypothetical protein